MLLVKEYWIATCTCMLQSTIKKLCGHNQKCDNMRFCFITDTLVKLKKLKLLDLRHNKMKEVFLSFQSILYNLV